MTISSASIGRVTIAPQVLTTIVRQTALGVEGVRRLVGRLPRRSKLSGRRAVAPGIEVIVQDGQVAVTVHVIAEPGTNWVHMAETLQTEITRAIEHIVGLQVTGVDVYIDDVALAQTGVNP